MKNNLQRIVSLFCIICSFCLVVSNFNFDFVSSSFAGNSSKSKNELSSEGIVYDLVSSSTTVTCLPVATLNCTGIASNATVKLNISNPCTVSNNLELKLWANSGGNLISIVKVASASLTSWFNQDVPIVTNKSLPGGINLYVRTDDPVTGENHSYSACGY